MGKFRVNLLGAFEVKLPSERKIALPGAKTSMLLAYLALSPGKRFSRETFLRALWGDRGDDQARGSLRQALWVIKKSFEEAGTESPVIAEAEYLSLDPSAVETDVEAFETLISEDTLQSLSEAVQLYRGELLEGIDLGDDTADHEIVTERQRLQGLVLSALKDLVGHQTEAGNIDLAIAWAQRLLTIDPLQEDVHRSLIKLYVASHQPGLALAQYERCKDMLARDLGITPSAETEAARAEIGKGPANGAVPVAKETARFGRFSGLGRPSLLILALTVMGTLAWMGVKMWDKPSPSPMQSPLSKPSIAVMPFVDLSDGGSAAILADGLAGDLIADLTKLSGLFVVSRQSSFAYRGKDLTAKLIGRELGVRYILGGSIQRSRDKLRITADLTDARNGEQLWAQRYERAEVEIFSVQDMVVTEIVHALAVRLTEREKNRLARVPTDNLEAYDLYLRAERQSYLAGDRQTYQKVLDLYHRAIELDPAFAEAHSGLARTFSEILRRGFINLFPATVARKKAYVAASRALRLDPNNARAFMVLAMIQLVDSEHDLALDSARKAASLQPNDPETQATLAFVLAYSGQKEKALEQIALAERFNLHPTITVLVLSGIVAIVGRRYEAAITKLQKAKNQIPDSEVINEFLAAAYAMTEDREHAQLALDAVLRVYPPANLAMYELMYGHYRSVEDRERYITALRRAGFPQWPHGYLPDETLRIGALDLPRIVIDRAWLGRSSTGVPFIQSIGPTGEFAYRSPNSLATGRAYIRDDRLCVRHMASIVDHEICGQIYRVPKSDTAENRSFDYVIVSPEAVRFFSLKQ